MTYIQLNQSRKKKLFLLASDKTITLTLLLLHLVILIIPSKKEHTIRKKNHHQHTMWIQQLPKDIHLTDMHHTHGGLAFSCHGDLKRVLESLEKMTTEPEACFTETNIHQNVNGKLLWEGKYKTT